MNMLLHGLPDARIEKGDTIRDPKLVEEGELLALRPGDRQSAVQPRRVGSRRGRERWLRALPLRRAAEDQGRFWPSSQHMVAGAERPRGRLGVVMPHGVLFRGAAEGRIRQGLLREDLFEAVIGLAPNLFYGTGIPASLLVLNRDKPAARKGKVLFIDASGEFEEGSNQNRLRDRDVEHRGPDLPCLCRRGGSTRGWCRSPRSSATTGT